MTRLGEIKKIFDSIKTAPVKAIKIIHYLIFENVPDDRKNRKRIREFEGFDFKHDSEDHKKKLMFINEMFSVTDLVTICNVLRLDFAGSKAELIERICQNLMDLDTFAQDLITEDPEDSEDELDKDEKETKISFENRGEDFLRKLNVDKKDSSENEDDCQRKELQNARRNVERQPHFSMTFRDIEGSIRPFNGHDGYPIKKWLTDFEETAILMGWNDMQKFIFAKKSLEGLAKLYIQGENGVLSWKSLKNALIEEFHTETSSAEIHKLLNSRRKKKEESIHEYFLVMKEIANRSNIDEESLRQYVIDGIEDNTGTKLILYGAKSLKDFKENLQNYERAYSRVQVKHFKPDKMTKNPTDHRTQSKETESTSAGAESSRSSFLKCFNCGKNGHRSDDCKHKDKGKKCFNCNNFGHIAADCKAEKKKDKKQTMTMSATTKVMNNYKMKEVQICNNTVNALIDCGCQLNLIRGDIYEKFSAPELKRTDMILTGFGKNIVAPQGYMDVEIKIDDVEFQTSVYVVSDDTMKMEMIIGNDLLDMAEVRMNRNGVTIEKLKDESLLMCINIRDKAELNIEDTTSEKNKENVRDLVAKYSPRKTKTVDVKMNISVKEEQPIYSRPRRLSPDEKKTVDEQVQVWLEEGIIERSSSAIIKSIHEKGHYASKRTEEEVKQEFHVPNLAEKVNRVITNCVKCLVVNRKAGKQEGFLNPINKESKPLHTLHMDHIGPLQTSNKGYKHILGVVDSFTKFIWLYPVKTTKTSEVITKMKLQNTSFGNPVQIITDRGSAFTSRDFEQYCEIEDIKHILITTGLPRANGQIERMNATIGSILAKLAIEDPTRWYKFVPAVQRAMNSTYQRSIGRTPFELMIGVKMRNKDDLNIIEMINKELIADFEKDRNQMREDAKLQILKIQEENQKTFNRKRKKPRIYHEEDSVAIKRTQFGPGLKLKPKYLGPYIVTKAKSNNTYDVQRDGDFQGPAKTTTTAEYMKPWPTAYSSSETDEEQDGRMWEWIKRRNTLP